MTLIVMNNLVHILLPLNSIFCEFLVILRGSLIFEFSAGIEQCVVNCKQQETKLVYP